MKIRLFFFLFFSLLIHTKQLCAQTNEFAPVGAKWWYELAPDIIAPVYQLYFEYEAEKDTLIDGINASKIVCYHVQNDGTETPVGYEYFSKDSLSIKFYRNGAFHTFLNYSDSTGDTVTVLDEEFNGFFQFQTNVYHSFKYIIDSTKEELYDGNILGTFYVHSLEESDYWFGDFFTTNKIVQNIGSINDISMIGFPSNIGFFGGIKGLRCYEDDVINLSFNGVSCDSLYDDLDDGSAIKTISLFYDGQLIHGILPDNITNSVILTDMQGFQIFSEIINGSFTIDTQNYNDGIYILKIHSKNNNTVFTEKIFVHH